MELVPWSWWKTKVGLQGERKWRAQIGKPEGTLVETVVAAVAEFAAY